MDCVVSWFPSASELAYDANSKSEATYVSHSIHLALYSIMHKADQIAQVLQEEAGKFRQNVAAEVSQPS